MQTTRPASIAALLLAASLLLSGCGSGGTEPTASPQSSGEPVFASEEEALAAAEDAFAAYLAMTNLIGQEGNVNPERIAPFVTENWLPTELEGFADPETSGRTQIGSATFDSAKFQQVIDSPDQSLVIVTVCFDLSGRTSVDALGNEVNLDDVPERILLEVALSPNPERPGTLLVESLEPWPEEHC